MPRVAARLSAAVALLLFCLSGYAFARAFGRPERWVRRFLSGIARLFGARVRTEGEPLPRDVLFVANHISWMDILVVGGATGAAFVSKDAVARWPVVGTLARIGGTIFVDRTSRGAARDQAEALRATLESGRPAAFFPEGTTGDGLHVAPFRASLFAAVAPTPPRGLRVQPVAIDYGAAASEIAWSDGEGTIDNALRVIGRRGALPVTLRFLPPIEPQSAPDRKQIAAAARTAIVAALPPAPKLG